jgi:hypothetical protein
MWDMVCSSWKDRKQPENFTNNAELTYFRSIWHSTGIGLQLLESLAILVCDNNKLWLGHVVQWSPTPSRHRVTGTHHDGDQPKIRNMPRIFGMVNMSLVNILVWLSTPQLRSVMGYAGFSQHSRSSGREEIAGQCTSQQVNCSICGSG